MHDNKESAVKFKVVMNHDRQYSIWPAERECPNGWTEARVSGEKSECLEYIKGVWTDMRPMKLRNKMEEDAQLAQQQGTTNDVKSREMKTDSHDAGNPLINFLSHGDHPLKFRSRSADGLLAFKENVGRGYVLITFTDTHGGTELGLKLDSNLLPEGVDWEKGTGAVELKGNLKLDGVAFSCLAQVDLATLSGSGKLQILS
jgi:uncharacterized protein YbdZ (MbtH family)